MAEHGQLAGDERAAALRREFLGQTARIPWHDLQRHYAGGNVVWVAPELDLVEVAVQLGVDNTALFQQWIESGSVASISDEQAAAWFESNAQLWAVVAAPWVLVQDKS